MSANLRSSRWWLVPALAGFIAFFGVQFTVAVSVGTAVGMAGRMIRKHDG